MTLIELAKSLDRPVQIQSSMFRHGEWLAYLENVGLMFGLVTVCERGNTPTDALEALAATFNGKELCVDGNTDRKRYIGPMAVTA